jgi:hypothetical protein
MVVDDMQGRQREGTRLGVEVQMPPRNHFPVNGTPEIRRAAGTEVRLVVVIVFKVVSMAKDQCVAWGTTGSTGWSRARNIDGRQYAVRLNDNDGQLDI